MHDNCVIFCDAHYDRRYRGDFLPPVCRRSQTKGSFSSCAPQVLRDVKHFVKDYHGEEALAAQGAGLVSLLSALCAYYDALEKEC